MGRRVSFLVTIVILFVACTKVESESVDAGLNSSAAWSVQFSISGGFAGVRQHLEVYQNGRLIAVDEKLDKKVTGELATKDVAEIQKLVKWRTGNLSPLPEKSRGSGCFDCFVYTVVSTLDGKKISKNYTGLNLVAENEKQLVSVLSKVLHDQLGKVKQ